MSELTIRCEPGGPPVLAVGAWFKNTVCAARDGEMRVSAPVGDLHSAESCLAHEGEVDRLLNWLGQPPVLIAHDLHPDFHSSRHAAAVAARLGVPTLPVQHHHAHIAALCAEAGWRGPVLGLACDGVGLGTDGGAWGGELLRVEGSGCERLGRLAPLPLPGGDRAALEPWRMALSVLHALGRGEAALRHPALAEVPETSSRGILALLVRATPAAGHLCPPTSSLGRVFDGVSALCGLAPLRQRDAEAAIALEHAAQRHVDVCGWPDAMPGGWVLEAGGELNLRPVLERLASEPVDPDTSCRSAALFHATLVAALADWLQVAAARTGLTTVALGGGCFFNRLLSSGLRQALRDAGLNVLTAQRLTPGDSAIAVGQAWIGLESALRREG